MIVDPTSKPHYRLNMDSVKGVMSSHAKEHEPTGELITSSWDLYSVEHLRDKWDLRIGNPVPCDIFVFGKGEPEEPTATKVGGQPAFPSDLDWPNGPSGQPLKFLAQFNFSESLDLFELDLPGTMLILAAENDEDWLWEDQGLQFIWLQNGSTLKPIRVPVVPGIGGPFYGVRYRTFDYPDSIDIAYELEVSQSYNLPILNGTKIGGVPAYIQGGGDPSGLFLGQLGSIQAAPYAPYPWTNVKESMGLDCTDDGIYGDGNCAVFGDMGNIYMHLDESGLVSRNFECY